ncbi:cytochrome c3 family protein [Pelagimonas varians]|uniref:Fumarate reductase flavoprotein subunit n=1 Tax=Pelagimonas varians TaxID=696760 RepID=A0A238JUY3_9RHOB|nr:cytochrome c3 family protein [Pelagimonas varians]PYG34359.1 cytochrome c3-like protein [Pelagimonas varians]SMX34303.1 Fumarate reductase flavoprotein subunit [Pelagimonas varians]
MYLRNILIAGLAMLVLTAASGVYVLAQTESLCVLDAQDACVWPAASGDEKPRQQRSKSHTGEPGITGHDGKPAPDHVCTDCHAEPDLLPDGHLRTAGMSMRGCRICHGTEAAASLDDRIFQSHTHFFAGGSCVSCHEDPEDVSEPATEVCTSCHGTLEALALKTEHVEHANPHASPHGAPYAECVLCHYQHEPPDNFCATCHDFEFEMP